MGKRITYEIISYGEWTRPRMKNFREQCCDCGLVHRLDFRIVNGRIEFRTRRARRVTSIPHGRSALSRPSGANSARYSNVSATRPEMFP